MEAEELTSVATAMFNLSAASTALAPKPTVTYPMNMWAPGWRWEVEMQDPPFHDRYSVLINISMIQPVYVTKPLYAIVVPAIMLVAVVTNSLVFFVMSQLGLRTPTNVVLCTMAVSELATGVSSMPWSLYYLFTEITPDLEMSSRWCAVHQLFALHLPSMFHTMSIWLTCYLAIQRCLYIFFPVGMLVFSQRTNAIIISVIILWATLSEFPKMMLKTLRNFPGRSGRQYCLQKHDWVVENYFGYNRYISYTYLYKLVFVHLIPCLLLTALTFALFCKLRWQDGQRAKLLNPEENDKDKKKKEDTSATSASEVTEVTEARELTAVEVMRSASNGDVAALESIQFIDEGAELGEYEVLISIENVEEGVERKKSFLDGLVEIVPPVIHEVIDEEAIEAVEEQEKRRLVEAVPPLIHEVIDEEAVGSVEVEKEIQVEEPVVLPAIVVTPPAVVDDDDAIEVLSSEPIIPERTEEEEIAILVEEIIVRVVAKVDGEQQQPGGLEVPNSDWERYQRSQRAKAARGAKGAKGAASATEPGERTPPKSYAGSSKLLFLIVAIHLLVEVPVAVVLVGRFYYELHGYDIVDTVFSAEFTNVFMVVRNFLIIITYPFNFVIYFGMSSQFKQELAKAIWLDLYILFPSLRKKRRGVRRLQPRSDDSGIPLRTVRRVQPF